MALRWLFTRFIRRQRREDDDARSELPTANTRVDKYATARAEAGDLAEASTVIDDFAAARAEASELPPARTRFDEFRRSRALAGELAEQCEQDRKVATEPNTPPLPRRR